MDAREKKIVRKATALRDMAPLYDAYYNPEPNSNTCIYEGEIFEIREINQKENKIYLREKLSPFPLDSFLIRTYSIEEIYNGR
jgi:5'-deoxynucleotidase YfbR-like HD superfamily hydrolase